MGVILFKYHKRNVHIKFIERVLKAKATGSLNPINLRSLEKHILRYMAYIVLQKNEYMIKSFYGRTKRRIS